MTVYDLTSPIKEAYRHIANIEPDALSQSEINTLYDIARIVNYKLQLAEGITR